MEGKPAGIKGGTWGFRAAEAIVTYNLSGQGKRYGVWGTWKMDNEQCRRDNLPRSGSKGIPPRLF